MIELFPLSEYWLFYLCFTSFVIFLLAIDLKIFHRKAHEISFKEGVIFSIIWITLGLLFSYFLYEFCLWELPRNPRLLTIPGFDIPRVAKQCMLEYLTGFIVEKSLSVDNLFVFLLLFNYFNIPQKYQHRVLFFGILGALFFRALFISIGSLLIQYHIVVILFGIFLVITGLKILLGSEKGFNPSHNHLIDFLQKHLPVTAELQEQHFFIRRNSTLFATPLLVALFAIELFDIVFAIDSIPAIYAITREPLIVYTSNIFALLGLRSLYFMLDNIMYRFEYIKYGLALVLVFVGLKMAWLNNLFDGKFPIAWSFGIIIFIIATTLAISFFVTRNKKSNL